VSAIEDPGDGGGAPLFHLLNGDLCYANLDIQNAPGVWRDFGVNVARSAGNRPWMPALGNHETEFGVCNHAGAAGDAPGGTAAQGAAGNYWNGPYGYGHYLSRFLLPDNDVTNWDGNHLRGKLLQLPGGDGDVHLPGRRRRHLPGRRLGLPERRRQRRARDHHVRSADPQRDGHLQPWLHTGDLKITAAGNAAVPDRGNGTPNLQTLWLERTLARARHDPAVDMIVVFMHQCAMSTSVPGNGSDLGIRRAWLPLFDRYEVDLVLSGHEHDYERTYPVRGYDPGSHGTVVSPNPGQAAGDVIDTRRPAVATTQPATVDGVPAWNTAQGTVFLVLGGGGTNGPSNVYGTDTSDGLAQAKVITERKRHHRLAGHRLPTATRPTPSRTRPGPRPPTPVMPTGMPSSTSTLASIGGRPPSPCGTSRSRP